jgi:hypothetical protein
MFTPVTKINHKSEEEKQDDDDMKREEEGEKERNKHEFAKCNSTAIIWPTFQNTENQDKQNSKKDRKITALHNGNFTTCTGHLALIEY